MILTFLRNTGQAYRMSLSCNLSEVFLMTIWGSWILRGRPRKYSAILITWHQGHMSWTLVVTIDINLHHLVKTLFVSFLHCEVTPPHLSMLCPLEGHHYAWCTPKKEGLMFYLLEDKVATKIILEFCMKDLSVHSHLFAKDFSIFPIYYLYQYRLTCIYGWVIIQ